VVNALGQGIEPVGADVQIAEFGKACQGGWERAQSVVVKVEKVGEAVEVAERFGDGSQLVVAEVQHAERAQVADPAGELGDAVFGRDQGLEGRLLRPIEHGAEALLPEAQIVIRRHLIVQFER
jgi:hypothetical protein